MPFDKRFITVICLLVIIIISPLGPIIELLRNAFCLN